MVKNLPTMQETQVWSLGPEGSLEKRMATLRQYSCLQNSLDRETWWVTVHGAPKSQIQQWLMLSYIYIFFLIFFFNKVYHRIFKTVPCAYTEGPYYFSLSFDPWISIQIVLVLAMLHILFPLIFTWPASLLFWSQFRCSGTSGTSSYTIQPKVVSWMPFFNSWQSLFIIWFLKIMCFYISLFVFGDKSIGQARQAYLWEQEPHVSCSLMRGLPSPLMNF